MMGSPEFDSELSHASDTEVAVTSTAVRLVGVSGGDSEKKKNQYKKWHNKHINDLVQERCNSIANAPNYRYKPDLLWAESYKVRTKVICTS